MGLKNRKEEQIVDRIVELLETKEEKKIKEDIYKYTHNEINISERFENYEKFKEYESFKRNEKIYVEKYIFKFIEKYIFNYYKNYGMVTEKNIRKDRKYFLKYIKEQVVLKASKKEISIENSLSFKSYNALKYKKIVMKKIPKYDWDKDYCYESDNDYYRRKQDNFIKCKKNKCFELLTIFPDIICFLVTYNYKINKGDKQYIDEKFFNIIKSITTNTIKNYSLKDLLRFYHELNNTIEFTKYDNCVYIGYSIFERIFKGYRTKLIFSKLNEDHRKLNTKLQLTLSIILQMKDLELSEKYINRALNKHSNLQRIFRQTLIYNLTYELIDNFIDIILESHNINCEGYCYKKNNIPEKIKELNYLITDKDEEMFLCLKQSQSFFETEKLGKVKLKEIEFFEDIESYSSIKLTQIEKKYEKINRKN